MTCYEGILDGRLYRKLFGDGEDPTGLHPLIQWLNFIVPEIRSLPEFPGMFTLSSPQRHTVYLWVAVHRRLVYLCENPDVKRLLDDGVYAEKAFPSDVSPALNGDEALYIDEETRDFKGYAPNGKCAELRWGQVLNTRLSDSLAMSDELVESLESEAAGVSSDESDFEQEGSRQRDSDGDNNDDDDEDEEVEEGREQENEEQQEEQEEEQEKRQEEGQEEKEQEEGQDRSTDDNVFNNAGTKPPITTETTPSAALEPSTGGRKRDREGGRIAEPVVSSTANNGIDDPTHADEGTQFTDSEGEGARRKRAALAWKWYLKSHYCS